MLNNPINLEGYVIRNKNTHLYLKKGGSSDTYSKNPQVYTKLHFLKSSITNKIKYNESNLQWLLEIEVINLQGNIIELDFVTQAIEYLESEYKWKIVSPFYRCTNLEYYLEQIEMLKGGNTNE